MTNGIPPSEPTSTSEHASVVGRLKPEDRARNMQKSPQLKYLGENIKANGWRNMTEARNAYNLQQSGAKLDPATEAKLAYISNYHLHLTLPEGIDPESVLAQDWIKQAYDVMYPEEGEEEVVPTFEEGDVQSEWLTGQLQSKGFTFDKEKNETGLIEIRNVKSLPPQKDHAEGIFFHPREIVDIDIPVIDEDTDFSSNPILKKIPFTRIRNDDLTLDIKKEKVNGQTKERIADALDVLPDTLLENLDQVRIVSDIEIGHEGMLNFRKKRQPDDPHFILEIASSIVDNGDDAKLDGVVFHEVAGHGIMYSTFFKAPEVHQQIVTLWQDALVAHDDLIARKDLYTADLRKGAQPSDSLRLGVISNELDEFIANRLGEYLGSKGRNKKVEIHRAVSFTEQEEELMRTLSEKTYSLWNSVFPENQ